MFTKNFMFFFIGTVTNGKSTLVLFIWNVAPVVNVAVTAGSNASDILVKSLGKDNFTYLIQELDSRIWFRY